MLDIDMIVADICNLYFCLCVKNIIIGEMIIADVKFLNKSPPNKQKARMPDHTYGLDTPV